MERKKHRGGLYKMQKKVFLCIMIPYLIFAVFIKGIPFLWGLYISFTNYTGFNLNNLSLVGLGNYIRVFTDSEAISSMLRTALIGLIVVPINIIICLFVSVLLSESKKGVGIYRTIYYIPSIVPVVATTMIWKGLFLKNGGFFNAMLNMLGMQAIDWYDFNHVRLSLIMLLIWGACGGVLNNIAAIKAIPRDLYEAADLEGVNPITRFFKITLPLISNMVYMNAVTAIIGILQLFAQPVLLSGDGGLTALPKQPVYTYMVHVYQQIFVNLRFGYGLALVWIIFIIIMSVTLINEKLSQRWVYTEVS